ncbi:uncharacterized protein EI90DRAFT_3125735 [Cantharellus anzutake]|uniref:uncharacterized protein n=1 Tax=Cantharellus anzutake TaxID=1750568 RepID=UPI0019055E97|nr:uncharacterized protein EI90DRAFT_3125735 [Cantharellus anzutake]KAF8328659.1 hypothetical protein EI90DRAFT_3125735 [Cantharellus anzutake]
MPKAPKADSEKPKREKKVTGEKRPTTLYQTYMKEKLPEYKAKNPGVSHKDAFSAVAKLWKDADENPNKGKDTSAADKPAKVQAASRKAPKEA